MSLVFAAGLSLVPSNRFRRADAGGTVSAWTGWRRAVCGRGPLAWTALLWRGAKALPRSQNERGLGIRKTTLARSQKRAQPLADGAVLILMHCQCNTTVQLTWEI